MENEILTSIVGIGTILSFVFTWYNSIKRPQEKSKEIDVRMEEKYSALRDIVINLRDNHLHTIECKIDKHIESDQKYQIDCIKKMTRIETLLDEIIKK